MQTARHIESFSASVPLALTNSVGFLLNEAATVIREMDEAALSGLGINPRQLGILMTIRVEGPQSQQAIGRKHRIDRTTMVKLTDALDIANGVLYLVSDAARYVTGSALDITAGENAHYTA